MADRLEAFSSSDGSEESFTVSSRVSDEVVDPKMIGGSNETDISKLGDSSFRDMIIRLFCKEEDRCVLLYNLLLEQNGQESVPFVLGENCNLNLDVQLSEAMRASVDAYNDVSFLKLSGEEDKTIVLIEGQNAYSKYMPLRCLDYYTSLVRIYAKQQGFTLSALGSTFIVPKPEFFVFHYNITTKRRGNTSTLEQMWGARCEYLDCTVKNLYIQDMDIRAMETELKLFTGLLTACSTNKVDLDASIYTNTLRVKKEFAEHAASCVEQLDPVEIADWYSKFYDAIVKDVETLDNQVRYTSFFDACNQSTGVLRGGFTKMSREEYCREEGREEGRVEGRVEGKMIQSLELAQEMLETSDDFEYIAKIYKLPIECVVALNDGCSVEIIMEQYFEFD